MKLAHTCGERGGKIGVTDLPDVTVGGAKSEGRSERKEIKKTMLRSRSRRALLASCVTGALSIASTAVLADDALAAETRHLTITNTEGIGVKARQQPSLASDHSVGPPEGASIEATCQTYGEPVGPNANRLWYRTTWSGKTFYVNDRYTDSPRIASDPPLPGLPMCEAPAPSTTKPAEPTRSDPTFNANAAADWAAAHVRDYQPFDAACTWFASQALWAGGVPQTDVWNGYTPQKGIGQWRPGTPTATVAKDLYHYLQRAHPRSTFRPITAELRTHALPEARRGDLIFYDYGDGISHATVVVNIGANNYPNVAEWGTTALNRFWGIHQRNRDSQRGWSWSNRDKSWLADLHPGMKAYLVQIKL
jgi:hypothetical protein